MNSDITYCNHHCTNTKCIRHMVNINKPGYYSLSDLSETELCEGKEDDND